MARARSTGNIEDVTGEQGKQNGSDGEQPAAEKPTPKRTPPELPAEKTMSAGELQQKMVTLYGPAGIGKSTLASQWADGEVFFFNCAGELGELEVYQEHIPSWEAFREYAWALAEKAAKDSLPYKAAAIDTADVLGRYCAETVRKQLGIVHESDLDWGKGWSTLRDAWQINIAKLAAIPDMGVVFVAHADEKEVKTRSSQYDKWQIRGVKGVRQTMVDMSDIVLFLDYKEGDEETRVIRTKPSRYWDAKERGQKPRLPAEIDWPMGENGWDIIKTLWDKGGE